MYAVKTPAPANQRSAREVTGSKPRASPIAAQPAPEMPAVRRSETKAPLSASPSRAPRAIRMFAAAKQVAEASAYASPTCGITAAGSQDAGDPALHAPAVLAVGLAEERLQPGLVLAHPAVEPHD